MFHDEQDRRVAAYLLESKYDSWAEKATKIWVMDYDLWIKFCKLTMKEIIKNNIAVVDLMDEEAAKNLPDYMGSMDRIFVSLVEKYIEEEKEN